MKKLYTIFLLLIMLIFLTTYTPSGLNVFPDKENSFFKIKKIEILNNHRISEKEIYEKLAHIYSQTVDVRHRLQGVGESEALRLRLSNMLFTGGFARECQKLTRLGAIPATGNVEKNFRGRFNTCYHSYFEPFASAGCSTSAEGIFEAARL